jgi:Na+/H+ antiporter NhaC
MTSRQVLVSPFAGVWIGALLVAEWNPIAATAVGMVMAVLLLYAVGMGTHS